MGPNTLSIGQRIQILDEILKNNLSKKEIKDKYKITNNEFRTVINNIDYLIDFVKNKTLGHKNKEYYSEKEYYERFQNYNYENLSFSEKQIYKDDKNRERYVRHDRTLE